MAEENKEGTQQTGPTKSQVDLSKSMLNLLKNIAKVTDKVTTSNSDQLDAINSMVDAIRERNEIEDAYVRKLEAEHQSFEMLYNQQRRRLKPLESMVAFNERLEKQYEKNNGHLRASVTAISQNLMQFEKLRNATAKVTGALETMRNVKRDFGKVLNSNTSTASKLVTVMSFGSKAMLKGFGAVGSALLNVTKLLTKFSLNLIKLGGKLVINSIKAIASPIGFVLKSIKELGFAVYKVYDFLTTLPYKAMNEIAKLGNEIRKELVETIYQASENTKELFVHTGSLGESVGNLKNIAAGSLLAFQNVNSNLVKLFGFGAEGIASMVSETTERIASLGVHAEIYGSSISKNTKVIEYFSMAQRALNLQTEDFGYIALQSRKSLVSMSDTVERFRHVIENSSEAFSINQRTMGKGFFMLRKDITNFGHLSDIELTNVVGRMTQLGVKIEDVAGLFSKFSTFEDAANTSALLAQTFGMNVDALDLISAKDPGKIVDMFRNAMMETGRSFDMLNRHEKELMASQTGMSAESLEMMMNFRNAGYTFEEAQKMMKDADPTQQQLKAIKEMTAAIKSLKKTMEFESPFDAIYQGMKQSLMRGGGEFRDFAMKISQGYENLYSYFASGNLTKALNNLVKPFIYLTDRLSAFFFSSEFKQGVESITKSLGDFFNTLFEGDLSNPEIFFDKLFNSLGDFFTKSFDLFFKGSNVATKASTDFLHRLTLGIAAMGPALLEQLRFGFDAIYSFIIGDKKITDSIDGKFNGVWVEVFDNYKKQWKLLKDDPSVNAFFDYLKTTFLNLADEFSNRFGDKIMLALTKLPGAEALFSDKDLVDLGKRQAKSDDRSLEELLQDEGTLLDLTDSADARNTATAAKLIEKARVNLEKQRVNLSSEELKKSRNQLDRLEYSALDSTFADDADATELIGRLKLFSTQLNQKGGAGRVSNHLSEGLENYYERSGGMHIDEIQKEIKRKERIKIKEEAAREEVQEFENVIDEIEMKVKIRKKTKEKLAIAKTLTTTQEQIFLAHIASLEQFKRELEANKAYLSSIRDIEGNRITFDENRERLGPVGMIKSQGQYGYMTSKDKTLESAENTLRRFDQALKNTIELQDGFLPSGGQAKIFRRGQIYSTLASDSIAVYDRNYAIANKPGMPTVNSNSSEASEILKANAEIIASVKALIESNKNRPIELKADVKLDGKAVGSGLLSNGLMKEAAKPKYGYYLNDKVTDSSTLANRETSSL